MVLDTFSILQHRIIISSMTFPQKREKNTKIPPRNQTIFNLICYPNDSTTYKVDEEKKEVNLPGGRELDWLTSCQASTINVNVPWNWQKRSRNYYKCIQFVFQNKWMKKSHRKTSNKITNKRFHFRIWVLLQVDFV